MLLLLVLVIVRIPNGTPTSECFYRRETSFNARRKELCVMQIIERLRGIFGMLKCDIGKAAVLASGGV